jgi:hypothetical protein
MFNLQNYENAGVWVTKFHFSYENITIVRRMLWILKFYKLTNLPEDANIITKNSDPIRNNVIDMNYRI